MDQFFSAFDKSTLGEWKDQIIKDLKGKDHALLEVNDSIEEIEFQSYYNAENAPQNAETPGDFPFKRGFNTELNNWANAAFILINNESDANKKALNYLMKGADMLVFKSAKENCDWNQVFSGIQFEFIQSQFIVAKLEEINAIQAILPNANFAYDFLLHKDEAVFKHLMASSENLALEVNSYAIQQAGANTWQEIAFCLNTGHEYLLAAMEAGLDISVAAQKIHFHIGVGSNYFNAIAKIRALRQLWAKVLKAYGANDTAFDTQILAVVGLMNKSLKDPYTNILRQTTETMSATNGANAVMVIPYDFLSSEGPTELAERMAINISLILKEESYLNMVVDPTGGSYSVEMLTQLIGEKAWGYFQQLERKGGLFNDTGLSTFRNDVNKKREQRIAAFTSGAITEIGMNKYPDPNERNASWASESDYLGMAPLRYDLITISETA